MAEWNLAYSCIRKTIVLGFIKKNVYRGKLIKFGETKIAEISDLPEAHGMKQLLLEVGEAHHLPPPNLGK
ncbi:hypothetical protein LWM68_42520 [Niabella sp. W65]|nr:hypothetical protein [Niabella sp. W65]MCH7368821.1 hypothetical protein [Niabella sp. W65]ULT44393.1 hypothetical protein KRR40_14210 [Niabella sp. I65]